MNEKILDEEAFREVGKYFLRNKKNVKQISINNTPDYHPFTRLLRVYLKDGREERFIIKILKTERWTADKSVADILHEITIQKELIKFGFNTRDHLLFETDINNPLGFPFLVTTYLKGNSLNTVSPETAFLIMPKVFDYLYVLHSKTISNSFGYSFRKEERYMPKGNIRFGEFEAKYFLSDIKRDNIRFNAQEKKDLVQAINSLNEVDTFSLCHCDVTLSNIIYDGSEIYLIDWTYSHFTEPAYDIAYIVFWLIEFGLDSKAKEEIRRALKRYELLGFDITPRFLFYLAQKYIEFGRFKGTNYIRKGKQLLKKVPTDSLEDLLKEIAQLNSKDSLDY